jgi:hypothetical protein
MHTEFAVSKTVSASRFASGAVIAFWLFFAALLVRLPFLRIAPNNTTDAWSRYHYAVLWLQQPGNLPHATSFGAWLPLHFWLLGGVLWITKSEMAARAFTVFLGALTIPFFWRIVKDAFGSEIALASSIALILFDFHITFSVTTGSEVPTIFFMTVGIYAWFRYLQEGKWYWPVLSALMLGAACLCRFEAWLAPPVLAAMTLDSGDDSWSFSFGRSSLGKAVLFGLLASLAPLGWMIFSFLKWGDPLELPHRTVWLNLHFRPPILQHAAAFRLLTVPVSLTVSLSPLIVCLACVGLVYAFMRSNRYARSLTVLVLAMLAFNYWSAIRYSVTQARYTLLYSWLLLPFAFLGALRLVQRWNWMRLRTAFAGTLIFFLAWQLAIIAGAAYARPNIADRLSVMSPTLPLHHEMRGLTVWLVKNHSPSSPMILDDFNWESSAISRFAHLEPNVTFHVTATHYSNPGILKEELKQFIVNYHPQLLVVSPYGPIGTMWSVDSKRELTVEDLNLQLQLKWSGEHWRVYAIDFRK